tara:strand:+ start:163 stop:543 length:381 start_codon:yes stop_codon:yes gene_type:complete
MESPEERELMEKCSKYFKTHGFDVMMDREVKPGHSQYGKSDIIAFKDQTIYVIECKYINRTNATKKRKKVKDQSLIYASIIKLENPDKIVKAYVFTNEGLQFLQIMSQSDAKRRAFEYFAHVGLKF